MPSLTFLHLPAGRAHPGSRDGLAIIRLVEPLHLVIPVSRDPETPRSPAIPKPPSFHLP